MPLLRFLRQALFSAWFFGLTTAMALLSVVLHVGLRRYVVGYARLWARLVLGGARVLCGIDWRVTGMEHLPARGPVLIAPMHQAAFDPLLWTVLRPDFAFVLKRELTRVPLFGALLRMSGMIVVDRTAGAAALRGMLREADRAIMERRAIVIFPEGTRRPPGSPVRLQPGVAALAARAGLPVFPVLTDSGLYWDRAGWRKRPGVIRVAIQPPLEGGLGREALLGRLAEVFGAGLPVPEPAVEKLVGTAA